VGGLLGRAAAHPRGQLAGHQRLERGHLEHAAGGLELVVAERPRPQAQGGELAQGPALQAGGEHLDQAGAGDGPGDAATGRRHHAGHGGALQGAGDVAAVDAQPKCGREVGDVVGQQAIRLASHGLSAPSVRERGKPS
jgi:hypothetical protein